MFSFGGKTTPLRDLSPYELRDALAAGGVTLVDVREPGEFAAARIEGAVNCPLSSFDPAKLPACSSTQWRCHHYSRATFNPSKPL